MSASESRRPRRRYRRATPSGALELTLLCRLIVGVCLLAGEWLLVSVLFDTGEMNTGREWWAIVVRKGPVLVQIAVGAGLLLCAGLGWSLRQSLQERSRPDWNWLAAHLVSYVALLLMLRFVLSAELRTAADPGRWVIGAGLLALGSAGLWLRAMIPAKRMSDAWRGIGVAGVLAAPAGVLAWGAGRAARELWLLLPDATLRLAEQMLRLTGGDVICRPEQLVIGLGTFSVTVSEDCSGYQGVGLIWLFLVIYLWVFRESLRFPQALLLLPLGTLAVYLMNAVRIVVLVLLGAYVSPDLALEAFHAQAGWIAFDAVGIALVLLTQRTAFLSRSVAVPAANEPGRDATAWYVAPFLVLVASAIGAAAFSSNPALWYPARVLAGALVLLTFWPRYQELRTSWSWGAVGLGLIVGGLWLLLEPADEAAGRIVLPAVWQPAAQSAWWGFRLVGTIVVVPLVEELAFRGYLMRRMESLYFERLSLQAVSWKGLIGSSILFGLLHPGHWIVGTVAGLLFGVAVQRRGWLLDGVVAHGVANALIAGVAVATGRYGLLT